jgi:hypothetical protein
LIKDKNILNRVQHEVTRWNPDLRKLNYELLLEILSLPPLCRRQGRADLIQMFRITHQLFPGCMGDFLEFALDIIKNPKLYPKLSSYHQYTTRSQDIDHISLRLTKSQDGIHYYCIKFFNALPDSHKNLPPNQFLKHIKTYLLNKIIYSFDEFLNNSSNDLK